MSADQAEPTESAGRVLPFRPRAAKAPAPPAVARSGPPSALADLVNSRPGRTAFADLSRYERHGDERDDYSHRMLTNIAALVICAFLVGAGVWLADKIVEMRKNQDCVLSGRPGCTHVIAPVRNRW